MWGYIPDVYDLESDILLPKEGFKITYTICLMIVKLKVVLVIFQIRNFLEEKKCHFNSWEPGDRNARHFSNIFGFDGVCVQIRILKYHFSKYFDVNEFSPL